MASSFTCPLCQATISGEVQRVGGGIRCPKCQRIVPNDPSIGTVSLLPKPEDHEKTVLLEAVEVTEAVAPPPAVEVTAAAERPEAAAAKPSPAVEPGAVRAADEDEGIGGRLTRRSKSTAVDIDMTPMVDVTFLLLIFFMVTATFTLQKSLEIPKSADQDPSTTVIEEDSPEQSDFVTVIVDEFNTFQIVTVDWEKEAPSEQDLHAMLREARGGDRTGTIPTKLRVEPHGDSLHQKVVAALDAGTANGFEEVLLVSVIDN